VPGQSGISQDFGLSTRRRVEGCRNEASGNEENPS